MKRVKNRFFSLSDKKDFLPRLGFIVAIDEWLIMFPIAISLTGDSTGRTNGFVIVQYALPIVISSDALAIELFEFCDRIEKFSIFSPLLRGCKINIMGLFGNLNFFKTFHSLFLDINE